MFVLTEKPSVANDIAAALGDFQKANFPFGSFWKNSHDDIIVSAAGHLLELFQPEDYNPSWKNWNLEDLPIIPENFKYQPIKESFDVLKKIKYCFDHFDSTDFVLATDAEREGEHIGALILNYVGFKHYDTAKRFWVSEALTPDVVKKGFENLKSLSNYESYKKAGLARARSDWLLGINISRLLALSTNTNAFFGRVQTAILGAIYLRDKNIANFKPVPYFQLAVKVQYSGTNFEMLFNKNGEDRFATKEQLAQRCANLKQKTLTVKEIQTERKTENQPQLFNITGLQKYCSNKYHLTPEETLSIAQELYEKLKCLSYPRTPSTVLGDDNVELFRTKFELLSVHYPQLAQRCANKYISPDNKRLFNSAKLQDHHALIPLAVLPADATEKQKNVYEAVLLRFFQTVMEPHIYEITTVKAALPESSDEEFIAKGKAIVQPGWKTTDSETDSEEEIQTLPAGLKKADKLPVIESNILEKETKPKKHYTNATILALMENPKGEDENLGKLSGIGTPATRAGIIAKLISRQYIQQKGQQLLITDKGKFIIQTVVKIPCLANLIKISTTTEWEEKLNNEPDNFLDENKDFLKKEIPQIKITDKWENTSNTIGECPVCHKGKITEGKKSFFCSEYKNGCKVSIWKDNFCHANITASDVLALISGKATKPKKMKSTKTGKDFTASLKATIEAGNLKILPVFN